MFKTNTGFLQRRNLFFILTISLIFSVVDSVWAEEAVQFMFGNSNKLKITERSNIRVSENDVYTGLMYNESRAVLDYMWFEDGYSQYSGNYYVYEASKKDTRLIANPVDLSEYCEIEIDDRGHYKLSDNSLVPVLRSFPVFPEKELERGDTWKDFWRKNCRS